MTLSWTNLWYVEYYFPVDAGTVSEAKYSGSGHEVGERIGQTPVRHVIFVDGSLAPRSGVGKVTTSRVAAVLLERPQRVVHLLRHSPYRRLVRVNILGFSGCSDGVLQQPKQYRHIADVQLDRSSYSVWRFPARRWSTRITWILRGPQRCCCCCWRCRCRRRVKYVNRKVIMTDVQRYHNK